MEQVKIEDGRLTNIMDCREHLDGFIILPPDNECQVGSYVDEYTSTWKLKSLQERFDQGLYTPPQGFKVVDNTIVELTEVEQIKAGLKDIPIGEKLVDDELIVMTDEELLDASLITIEDFNKRKIRKLKGYLNSTDWYYIRYIERQIAVPDEVQQKRADVLREIQQLEG